MRPISKKEAREKYGICTNGASSMCRFFLREDGCVVDESSNIRYCPPQVAKSIEVTIVLENGYVTEVFSNTEMPPISGTVDKDGAIVMTCKTEKEVNDLFKAGDITETDVESWKYLKGIQDKAEAGELCDLLDPNPTCEGQKDVPTVFVIVVEEGRVQSVYTNCPDISLTIIEIEDGDDEDDDIKEIMAQVDDGKMFRI